MARRAATDRQLTLTTPLGPDVLLPVAFSAREALSEPYVVRVDCVASNDATISFDALLGQPAVLTLTGSRFFSGIVNGLTQGARGPRQTSYRLLITPQLSLLDHNRDSRIFQNKSVPDILDSVLDGIRRTSQIQGTFKPRNYCVQYRESDFAFASRLLEEEGIYYFFEHGADGHTLVLANTPDSHPDLGTVPFDAGTGPNTRAGGQVVYQWTVEQDLTAGKVTLRDFNFELPSDNLEAGKPIQDSVQVGTVAHRLQLGANENLEDYDFPGGYAKRFDGIDAGGGGDPAELQNVFTDATRTAGIRAQQEAVQAVQIGGAATARGLVAGHRFTLQGHFNGDGPYVLTSLTHSAQVTNADTGALSYASEFTAIPLGLPYRPPQRTPRPVVAGPQTATVVGPAGEEVFTDKYARVKVQFHWDREGKKDASSSCWVRVGAVFATRKFGVIDIPRIGQEVVVAFEEGDPDRPIVVGSVYNPEFMPPQPWPPPPQ